MFVCRLKHVIVQNVGHHKSNNAETVVCGFLCVLNLIEIKLCETHATIMQLYTMKTKLTSLRKKGKTLFIAKTRISSKKMEINLIWHLKKCNNLFFMSLHIRKMLKYFMKLEENCNASRTK